VFLRDDGVVWGASHQQRPLEQASRLAEISPSVTFHVLRHTHASQLAMRGVPMAVIAKQLGHADTRMTEKHYAHLAPNYVADTIRANFPNLGIGETLKVVPVEGGREGWLRWEECQSQYARADAATRRILLLTVLPAFAVGAALIYFVPRYLIPQLVFVKAGRDRQRHSGAQRVAQDRRSAPGGRLLHPHFRALDLQFQSRFHSTGQPICR